MGKIYEKPPVAEAICEFRFEPAQPWDWTIPGLIYAQVKESFPKKKERYEMPIEFRPSTQEIAHPIKGQLARMQFLREDERALIQLGPDLLAVNHLKPYPTWETFKAMISRALAAYREVAHPIGLRRIGLRYINRIEIPQQRVEIEDYLQASPRVPSALPQVFATWAQRVEMPIDEANDLLVLQSGSVREKDQNNIVFMLDLDFVTLNPDQVSLDGALEWVERSHTQVETFFEACITEKARELFKEVKQCP